MASGSGWIVPPPPDRSLPWRPQAAAAGLSVEDELVDRHGPEEKGHVGDRPLKEAHGPGLARMAPQPEGEQAEHRPSTTALAQKSGPIRAIHAKSSEAATTSSE